MTYLDRINAFEKWLEQNYLPVPAQLMYYKFLMLFNKRGWSEWIQVDNRGVMYVMQLTSEKTMIQNRDKLVNLGLIEYRKGRKGTPNQYRLLEIKNTVNFTVETKVETTVKSDCTVNPTVKEKVNMPVETTAIYRHKTKTETKTKERVSNETPKKVDVFGVYAAGDTALLDALQGFEEMRKSIKKPMTDRAKQQLCSKLDTIGNTPEEKISLLNEAIEKCWLSVYKNDGAGYSQRNAQGGSVSAPIGKQNFDWIDQIYDEIKSRT